MCATANLPLAKSPAVTPPPDLGSGRSSGCSQSQLRPGSGDLDASQTLCEKVRGHVCCRHVAQHDLTSHNDVAHPVEAQVKVLHASMMLRVLANLNCRLIVQKQKGRARDGKPSCPSSARIQTTSWPAEAAATNSRSVVERATMDWRQDDHETAPEPILTTYALVERPLSKFVP
jgi:hypothetical protein